MTLRDMAPLFLAIRAISSEFARRIYVPAVVVAAAVVIALLTLGGWLTTYNGWWWILEGLFFIGTVVLIILFAIVGFAITALRPQQSKEQRRQVAAFVTTLQEVSEVIQMPKFMLLFNLAKDTLLPREDGFVHQMIGHATSLKPSFTAIVTSFKKAV